MVIEIEDDREEEGVINWLMDGLIDWLIDWLILIDIDWLILIDIDWCWLIGVLVVAPKLKRTDVNREMCSIKVI